ncbi:hypothetical protein B0I21_11149 [Sphingobacterium paludis]|uniref:Uncharacterized protein n=1 Tax=Sphingobacterium paludis TaxID=1476465 RepID=A0A4R7CV51_9SPHI|nr:hypothetical protein B0I21_11149 [Sphingobacterium paludis]
MRDKPQIGPSSVIVLLYCKEPEQKCGEGSGNNDEKAVIHRHFFKFYNHVNE